MTRANYISCKIMLGQYIYCYVSSNDDGKTTKPLWTKSTIGLRNE